MLGQDSRKKRDTILHIATLHVRRLIRSYFHALQAGPRSDQTAVSSTNSSTECLVSSGKLQE